ncbi:MAG TPA: aminoglycoside phosphotransferase family protein [Urbifossiella sp.]|nr:aminoglycoside phosphotransferase family protein [Urbifossiella sp.]
MAAALQWPVAEGVQWARAPGGLSGAAVWRSDAFALKMWPTSMPWERLARIHSWMDQAGHLAFVPKVMRTRAGSTIAEEDGRIWDLTTWMPGEVHTPLADASGFPNCVRPLNACSSLAELHRGWHLPTPRFEPCPGVLRRMQVLADWKKGRGALAGAAGLVHRASEAVDGLVEAAERALTPWQARTVPLHPCLCDVHREHVLYTGNEVTGIIDYGAMKIDNAAVDLARMLGDFVGDDDAQLAAGVEAYRAANTAFRLPTEFVRLLDRTGVLGGAIVWMLRFIEDSALFDRSPAALQRFANLVERIDNFRGI